MRSRFWSLGMATGTAGIALSVSGLLPPLPESVVLGASIGLVLVGPVVRPVSARTPRSETTLTPEEKLKMLVETRRKTRAEEHERVLDSFDDLLSRVEEIDDPVVNRRVTKNFGRFVRRLTKHYPEWDPEGRLRTYVLMRKIADSLDLDNADTYLEMAYRTLIARGAEAAELSHITLNGKVERIYRNPESERAHRLAGTLLLMNRGDDEYVREMVVEAIHLWSKTRFRMLREDFAAVSRLGAEEEKAVVDLLEKEMAKSKRAGDKEASERAKQLWMTVSVSGSDSNSRP